MKFFPVSRYIHALWYGLISWLSTGNGWVSYLSEDFGRNACNWTLFLWVLRERFLGIGPHQVPWYCPGSWCPYGISVSYSLTIDPINMNSYLHPQFSFTLTPKSCTCISDVLSGYSLWLIDLFLIHVWAFSHHPTSSQVTHNLYYLLSIIVALIAHDLSFKGCSCLFSVTITEKLRLDSW